MTNFKDIFDEHTLDLLRLSIGRPRTNVLDRQTLYPQVLLGRYHKCITQMKCWGLSGKNDRETNILPLLYKD